MLRFCYLSNIRNPETVTKIEKMNFTAFNFSLVNKKAPSIPPIIADGKIENSPFSSFIYPFNKYSTIEIIDIGSIVATALAKTPFCFFCSLVKMWER